MFDLRFATRRPLRTGRRSLEPARSLEPDEPKLAYCLDAITRLRAKTLEFDRIDNVSPNTGSPADAADFGYGRRR
jgi:hypothetical protein